MVNGTMNGGIANYHQPPLTCMNVQSLSRNRYSLSTSRRNWGAALSFKYYQHCFPSMKESILVVLGSGFVSRIIMIPNVIANSRV
ncbi:hypothetical protein CUMW_262540 [Citrus unshiu]|uniref:Uncharacterized protein n=2 Tax=Citrus unshiu TaxID=55188 RepID=A0A2H5QVC4_CITUN|nr:hypothetical protein CUMW_262540 [Citrus unshiu]